MNEQHLVVLMVKLALAACLASILTRFPAFQQMLMREERTLPQRIKMALVCGSIYGLGVLMRVLASGAGTPAAYQDAYQAMDLGLESSLVMGMLGGYMTGLFSGILIAIPAMFNGELLTMPLLAAVGVTGGLLRDVAPNKEYIWKISPFPDLELYRLLRKRDLQMPMYGIACLGVILLAEGLRSVIATKFPLKGVFALQTHWDDANAWMTAAPYAVTLFATILPIKIWNSSRNEKILEQQQRRLNEARLAALSSQINPHFLFNTLNSVAALIRQDQEKARQVVFKLSKILRRLLKTQDNLISFGEELSFIDDYLAIEMVRFGDKLRFVKQVDAACLDLLVPSMLLQPLVENSIRHGLASKVDGGTIRVSARREAARLHILVEDDGVGIPEGRLVNVFELGIGVSNVNERLKVLYGDHYKMWMDSRTGEGTSTGIEIPEQVSGTVYDVASLAGNGVAT